MKFTKCVIGANYTPVGFVFENRGVECYEDYSSLCRRKADDGKLSFSDSGVFGLGNYAANGIEICRETVGGGYSDPIDPSLELKCRIISGGKVVGFVLKDGIGTETKKHVATILSASKYMKPKNYMVVEREGAQYLKGKGIRLSELPSMDITPGLTTTAKPRTVRTEPHDVVDPKLVKGVSLVRLTELIDECGGYVLKMPTDKYAPVGEKVAEDGVGFQRMPSVCEIAPPVLSAATTKVSASYKYKVPGYIMTSEGPALAYIYRSKNVVNVHYDNGVLRGDNVRLGRIGIVIPQANLQRFYSAIAGTVHVIPMEDNQSALDAAIKLINIIDPVCLEADLQAIPVLGAEYDQYLMAGEQVTDAVTKIAKYKYISAFLKTMLAGLRGSGISLGDASSVWKYYSRFSSLALDQLKAARIDVTTGIYTDSQPNYSSNKSAVSSTDNAEIIYELEDTLKAPKDYAELQAMLPAGLPQFVQDELGPIISIQDPAARLKTAENVKQKSEAQAKKIELQLFKHKVAMLLDGNNTIHSHDRDEWSLVKVSPKFTKFRHTSGVILRVSNVSMGK